MVPPVTLSKVSYQSSDNLTSSTLGAGAFGFTALGAGLGAGAGAAAFGALLPISSPNLDMVLRITV